MSSSISTRTGDNGTTGLMYNRRLPKTHPQIEACGALDELSATLTMARALDSQSPLNPLIYQIQQDLVALMAELALDPEDWGRYQQSTLDKMDPSRLDRIDRWIAEFESKGVIFQDWNLIGFSPFGASLEQARTICRRGERRYWALPTLWQQEKPLLGQYLNRLSDLLWLMARIKY